MGANETTSGELLECQHDRQTISWSINNITVKAFFDHIAIIIADEYIEITYNNYRSLRERGINNGPKN